VADCRGGLLAVAEAARDVRDYCASLSVFEVVALGAPDAPADVVDRFAVVFL